MRTAILQPSLLGCSLLAAIAGGSAHDGSSYSVGGYYEATVEADTVSDQSLKLRQDMRKLWSDHVIWTRYYIVAAVADGPDQKAASDRLLKNQEDIGNAVSAYYGKAAGDKLTGLLKEHIMIAVELIDAAKTGDNASVKEIDGRWQANGDEIATFLSAANPYWPKATLADMMKMHLSTTTSEVTARLEKKWEQDVKAFDDVYDHILKMADALSDGIIKQFPDRFSGGQ